MSSTLSDITPHHVLDATGLTCPEPVMLLHSVVRDALAGEYIHVNATDPSTTRDIATFCRFLGHTLISSSQDDTFCTVINGETFTTRFEFIIKKGGKATP